MNTDKPKPDTFPLLIDGGLSNVLEGYGCDLKHPLWSAIHLKENPEVIIQAHLDYIKAGARCITSASYQASIEGFMNLGLEVDDAENLILQSISLCEKAISQARQEEDIKDKIWIAASMGPYGAFLADGSEYTGYQKIDRSTLLDFHKKRTALFEGSKADILAYETIPDIREVKVICEITEETSIPAWLSMACKNNSRLSDETPLAEAAKIINDTPGIFAVGINCTAPEYVSHLIEILKEYCPNKKLLIYPNSGEAFNAESKTWSGNNGVKSFAEWAIGWLEQGVDMIGGCCRVGPKEIGEVGRWLGVM